MALLDVDSLHVELPVGERTLPVVHEVSLALQEGRILGVAGESGSGKTMTGLALMGLLPAGASTTGQAFLSGVDLLSLTPRERRHTRGRDIAMVFQDPMSSLHPMLTIGRQLTDHLRYHRRASRQAARARATELLEQVRLPSTERMLRSYPHQLSGGMRQRIAIAMALACDPKVIVADEPTTALDVTVQAGILELLDDLRRTAAVGIIVITHDLGVLSSLADEIAVFYAGRIIEESRAAQQVFREPRHPYTRALLDALPAHARAAGAARLTPMPGAPPSLGDIVSGCAFHTRCRFAGEQCTQAVPPLAEVSSGHLLACVVDPWRSAS